MANTPCALFAFSYVADSASSGTVSVDATVGPFFVAAPAGFSGDLLGTTLDATKINAVDQVANNGPATAVFVSNTLGVLKFSLTGAQTSGNTYQINGRAHYDPPAGSPKKGEGGEDDD